MNNSYRKIIIALTSSLLLSLLPGTSYAVQSETPIDDNEEGNIANSSVFYAYACSQKGDASGDLVVLESEKINGKPVPIKFWYYKNNDQPVPASAPKNPQTMYWKYKIESVNSTQFKAPFLDCQPGQADKLRVITQFSTNGEDPLICTTGFDVWRAYGKNELKNISDIAVWSHSRANVKEVCKPDANQRAFVPIAPHPDDSSSTPSGSMLPWRSAEKFNNIQEEYVEISLDSKKPGTLKPTTLSGNCKNLMTRDSNPYSKAYIADQAKTLEYLNSAANNNQRLYGNLSTYMVNGKSNDNKTVISWDDNVDCSGDYDFATSGTKEEAVSIAVCSTEIRERVRKFYRGNQVYVEQYVDTLGGKRYNRPTQSIALNDANQEIKGLRERIYQDIINRNGESIVGPPQNASDFPPSIKLGASDYRPIAAKYAGIKKGKKVIKSGKTLGIYVDERERNFYKSNNTLVPSYKEFNPQTMYRKNMVRVYEGTLLKAYPESEVRVENETFEEARQRSLNHTLCQFSPIDRQPVPRPTTPVEPPAAVTVESVVLDVYIPESLQVGGTLSDNRKYTFKAQKGQTICRDENGRRTPCTGGVGQTCPKGVLDSPPCIESLKFDIELSAPNYPLCRNQSDKACDYYITPQNNNYSPSPTYIQPDIMKTAWFYKATDKSGPLQVKVTDGNGSSPSATFQYSISELRKVGERCVESYTIRYPIYDYITDEDGNVSAILTGFGQYELCTRWEDVMQRFWKEDRIEPLPVIVNMHIQKNGVTIKTIRANSKSYAVVGSSSKR
jgi:hypothetical protein